MYDEQRRAGMGWVVGGKCFRRCRFFLSLEMRRDGGWGEIMEKNDMGVMRCVSAAGGGGS